MEIHWYPAMTPEEIAQTQILPEHYAWMAAHFDAKGDGLTDLPEKLSEDAILILNDEIPYAGHSSEKICQTIMDCLNRWKLHGILLDFERPVSAQLRETVKNLVASLPCPVACGQKLDIPELALLIPMPELLEQPEVCFRNQKGAWLEVRKQAAIYRVDQDGCSIVQAAEQTTNAPEALFDSALCAHYQTASKADSVEFILWRDREDRKKIMEIAKATGIKIMVGLYQELGIS